MANKQHSVRELTQSPVQLLPHAEHIVVLNEEGRVLEKGSFDHLNASGGYVEALGLKKSAVQEAAAVVEEEEEEERLEKEKVLVKITSQKAESGAAVEKGGKSRGKRNADALFSYMKSMGNVYFPVFCIFTVCNIGFRSAQRKRHRACILPIHRVRRLTCL